MYRSDLPSTEINPNYKVEWVKDRAAYMNQQVHTGFCGSPSKGPKAVIEWGSVDSVVRLKGLFCLLRFSV